MNRSLGEAIRDEREWCGFTRAQVATALDVPEATIAAYEDGTQTPGSPQLDRLARLFGTTPARLLGEPLAVQPGPVCLLTAPGAEPTAEDRYHVARFAEFLQQAGPAPRVTRQAERPEGTP